MLRFKKGILITALAVVIMTSSFVSIKAFAKNNDEKNSQSVKTENTTGTARFNGNPSPTYTANKNLDISKFISKENMLKMHKDLLIKNTKTIIKSIDLETYGEYSLKADPDKKIVNGQIDNDRMVWVISVEFPDGLDAKPGHYDNGVVVTYTYDAQTGNPLESYIDGKLTRRAERNLGPNTK